MADLNKRLFLSPPTRPTTAVRPLFRRGADHVPILSDYVKILLDKEQLRRDSDLQEYCERVAEAINNAAENVQELESRIANKIDAEHLWSTEFFRRFAATASVYTSEPDENKREFLVKFIKNYAMEARPDVTLIQLFWNIVRDLTGIHMVLLSRIYSAQKLLAEQDLRNIRSDRSEAISLNEVKRHLKLEDGLLDMLTLSLISAGLIKQIPGPRTQSDTSDRLVLEPVGIRFFRFVMGDWK